MDYPGGQGGMLRSSKRKKKTIDLLRRKVARSGGGVFIRLTGSVDESKHIFGGRS